MTAQVETRRYEAEVQELLSLVIHSLYTQKDIFLRELISNASDACDKLRIEALSNKDLLGEDEELWIRLEVDENARTLSVIDNGIGMSRDELAENLGTIARSGTRQFLDQLKQAGEGAARELIGQFGVGFYASFMVADEVTVESRRAGSEKGTRWRSTADGQYTLEDIEKGSRGTRVTLHLKPKDEEDEDPQDFLQPWTLRAIVKRYSDFVEYPIYMEVEDYEIEKDEEGKPKEGAEPKKITRTDTLNSRKPLWSRDKKDIEPEEYAEFYRHVAHDWNEPLETIHLKTDVPVEYTALLYIPAKRPMDFLHRTDAKSHLALYVRRVLIMADCEDLLPPWLRFVRGVVESGDLPLNVSRQTLQANPVTRKIQKHLTGKVLRGLKDLLEKDRERYQGFFDEFGSVLKEGIYQGEDDDNRISSLCLFRTSKDDGRATLPEYADRMPVSQEAIYYLVGMDADTAASSPHLEAFRVKGYEVLLMTDPVDEWMLQRLTEFRGKPLKSITQGDLDLGDDEEKKASEEKQAEHKDLLEALQKVLDDDVSEVRVSGRLQDSPAVLVSPEGAVSPAMERVMREVQGADLPKSKRILELNAEHPVMRKLEGYFADDPDGEALKDYAFLLYGQALLAEGQPVPEPARFGKLVTRLMVGP